MTGMRKLTLLLVLAVSSSAQSPSSTGPAAPDPRGFFLSPDEVAKVRQLIEQAFPPSLVGQILPAKFRASGPSSGTVAVFMASTCPHCIKEVPLFKSLSDAGIRIMPVFFSEDTGAPGFLQRNGWDQQPILATTQDLGSLRIRGTPTTVVAGPDGKITSAFVGELNPAQEQELRKLANAPVAETAAAAKK